MEGPLMKTHLFETRDLAEAHVASLGFSRDPHNDVWTAPDGHRLGYIVRGAAGYVVTTTVNRTLQVKVVPPPAKEC
jgi:hypothetical protein